MSELFFSKVSKKNEVETEPVGLWQLANQIEHLPQTPDLMLATIDLIPIDIGFLKEKNLDQLLDYEQYLATLAITRPTVVWQLFQDYPIEHLSSFSRVLLRCLSAETAEKIAYKLFDIEIEQLEDWMINLLADCTPYVDCSCMLRSIRHENLDDLQKLEPFFNSFACSDKGNELWFLFADKSLEELIVWQDVLSSFLIAGYYVDEIWSLVSGKSLEELSALGIESLLLSLARTNKAIQIWQLFSNYDLSTIDESFFFDWQLVIAYLIDAGLIDLIWPKIRSRLAVVRQTVELSNSIFKTKYGTILLNCFFPEFSNADKQDLRILSSAIRSGLAVEVWSMIGDNISKFSQSDQASLLYNLALADMVDVVWEQLKTMQMEELDHYRNAVRVCARKNKEALLISILFQLKISLGNLDKVANFNISNEELDEALANYRELIEDLSFPELLFFNLLITGNGLMNKRVLLALIRLGRFAFEINKTGSRLIVVRTISGQLVLVNEISNDATNNWQLLSSGTENYLPIPSAPILRTKILNRETIRVFSRFCGLAIANISLGSLPTEVVIEIDRQKQKILKNLEERKISHGHTHDGNFVVELIKKEYFLLHGGWKAINTMPFNADYFSYEMKQTTNWQDWQVVVRLIDFDRATSLEEV